MTDNWTVYWTEPREDGTVHETERRKIDSSFWSSNREFSIGVHSGCNARMVLVRYVETIRWQVRTVRVSINPRGAFLHREEIHGTMGYRDTEEISYEVVRFARNCR